MPCTVKITGGKSDISLDQDIRIKVLFDTEEEHVFQKSNSVGATVTISGSVDEDSKEAVIQVSRWSRDFTADGIYRQVEITDAQKGTDTVLRTYIFPQMFILSYEEDWGESNAGNFKLVLKQRKNSLQSIETF